MTYDIPEQLNIAALFLEDRLAEGAGDRVALRFGDEVRTYAEVAALARRFGSVLARAGVRQEERVVIALPDGEEFVGALFGTLALGSVVVMVNPRLDPGPLTDLLAYVRPSAAVVTPDVAPLYLEARGRAGAPARLLTVGGAPPAGVAAFEDEVRAGDDDLRPVATHRDDPAIWLFSGGTTGRPKAVVQTHRSFANTTELYARRVLGYRPDDITLSVPKLYFGYATGSNLFFPFSVGASAVLFPEHPTADILFDEIRRHRPTILINVPTMVRQMVAHPAAAEQDLSCLRFATSAGEALPASLWERWRDTFGSELLDGLGTAEMWHVFLTNRPGDVRPGTLGRVVPGFEVRVCDDDGRELPRGEVGRLWVRGDSRAIGYWREMDKTAEAFRGPWFVGGDLVSMDGDGFVTYCGRDDDVLKVGGKWLSPKEVESCLLTHDAVGDCAVVGVEDEDGLTKPVAFVVCRDEAGARHGEELREALKAFVLERLEPYKHPRRVILLPELPRTHLGKVDRGKLRAEGSLAG